MLSSSCLLRPFTVRLSVYNILSCTVGTFVTTVSRGFCAKPVLVNRSSDRRISKRFIIGVIINKNIVDGKIGSEENYNVLFFCL